jgi:ABC-type uncharacterized transport system YnjBCD permease subunit
MNNTFAIVGIIVLVLYVAFRCVIFFGERLWKRSQQGHHDLAQEHFSALISTTRSNSKALLSISSFRVQSKGPDGGKLTGHNP